MKVVNFVFVYGGKCIVTRAVSFVGKLQGRVPRCFASQAVARNSHGVAGFRCCRRNCDAKHRGTRPCNLPTKRYRSGYAVHKDEIDDFHKHLNEQHADIQFTREIEEDGKLPFLDCLVSHDNNELRTTVYRKPTHTDRLLDESSYNPTSHKATTIKTLTRRANWFVTQQTVCLTKTKTLTVFSTRTTTTPTSLDETLTELLKLQKPTRTLHLLLQRLYPTSRALLRPSRGFYNLTISV